MSYQVLARKWRPKQFSEVLGQKHITQTLVNSIKSNKIAHAYLLTGTRGVGKTTIARIFAKAIRCENLSESGEPCLKCNSCTSIEHTNSLDYLEIDGASNNSVDDIRDLIESVQYLPTTGKYKVYVIDEVHMLSVSAFNALLKTLEEPPEHVVFIFATTDPQKLLGTVLSRCQRFDFKNAGKEDLVEHLKIIAKSENIEFESEELIKELAKQGRGSVRDTLSLFDQVISLSLNSKITEDILYMSLGMANTKVVKNLVEAILSKDKSATQKAFEIALDENIDLKVFSHQILDAFYKLMTNLSASGEIQNSELDSQILAQTSLVEIMWIYESLYKDIEWALESMAPEKAMTFAFIKSSLRELILNKSAHPIVVKKKTEIVNNEEITQDEIVHLNVEVEASENEVPSTPIVQEESIKDTPVELNKQEVETKNIEKNDQSQETESTIQKEVMSQESAAKKYSEKSWENFNKFLYDSYKGLAVNVERGNLDNPNVIHSSGNKTFIIAFTEECKIFLDYLQEPDKRAELNNSISEFFEIDQESFSIELRVVAKDQEEDFRSSVQIEEEQIANKKEQMREDLLNNKYIQEAEKLFNSKIDKVILNDEN